MAKSKMPSVKWMKQEIGRQQKANAILRRGQPRNWQEGTSVTTAKERASRRQKGKWR